MSDSELTPVANSKIFIGGVKAPSNDDFIATNFNGQSWIEIDGWETAGSVGDTAQLITTTLINRGRDLKTKGTANAGQMQNNFAILASDPGQIALKAAAQGSNKNNYAFKIEYSDKPATGIAPKPTTHYFVAIVMGAAAQNGNANTARMLQATLEINSNIVEVAATTG